MGRAGLREVGSSAGDLWSWRCLLDIQMETLSRSKYSWTRRGESGFGKRTGNGQWRDLRCPIQSPRATCGPGALTTQLVPLRHALSEKDTLDFQGLG